MSALFISGCEAPHMNLQDWPAAERPREKLLAAGAAALSDAELLALLPPIAFSSPACAISRMSCSAACTSTTVID